MAGAQGSCLRIPLVNSHLDFYVCLLQNQKVGGREADFPMPGETVGIRGEAKGHTGKPDGQGSLRIETMRALRFDCKFDHLAAMRSLSSSMRDEAEGRTAGVLVMQC